MGIYSSDRTGGQEPVRSLANAFGLQGEEKETTTRERNRLLTRRVREGCSGVAYL